MTRDEFLQVLNEARFTERYWALCDAYSLPQGEHSARSFTKAELTQAFRDVGAEPQYDARDRSVSIALGSARDLQWTGVLAARRSGQMELVIGGEGHATRLGDNFAVLAYDARRALDPAFSRDRFAGPPPYPRPDHNDDPKALVAIVEEFAAICDDVVAALRR